MYLISSKIFGLLQWYYLAFGIQKILYITLTSWSFLNCYAIDIFPDTLYKYIRY